MRLLFGQWCVPWPGRKKPTTTTTTTTVVTGGLPTSENDNVSVSSAIDAADELTADMTRALPSSDASSASNAGIRRGNTGAHTPRLRSRAHQRAPPVTRFRLRSVTPRGIPVGSPGGACGGGGGFSATTVVDNESLYLYACYQRGDKETRIFCVPRDDGCRRTRTRAHTHRPC